MGAVISINPESGWNSIAAQFGALPSYNDTAFPLANRAIFIPFRLDTPFIACKLASYTGLTASGNIDVGIYDVAGTKLVSKGSTAQTSPFDIQVFDITDTLLGPGLYYFAVAMDNTTGKLLAMNPTQTAQLRAMGLGQMASAFVLPATATLVALSTTFCPAVAIFGKGTG